MQATSGESAERTHFQQVLGLPPVYTLDDIKAAYRRQVMLAHPDRGGRAEDFERLQAAYEKAVEYVRIVGDGRGWLGGQVRRYVPQERVIAEVRRRGGQVQIETLPWLDQCFGEGFAMLSDRLRGIRLHGPAADDAFLEFLDAHRRGLLYLTELDLSGGHVSDAGLPRLAGLDLLQRLSLAGTAVSRRGLQSLLPTLPALEWLNIADTRVGWLSRMALRYACRQVAVVKVRPGRAPVHDGA
jgi:hypothetical protein